MKISIWRPKLLTWLQSQITVDSWVLETPDQPGEVTGFLPPLRDLLYTATSPIEIEAEAVQDIYILKAYSGDLRYQDLPIASLEGLYQTIAIRIQHDWKTLCPELSGLEFLRADRPVAVKELGDGRSEWLVELHWFFQIKYIAEPEVGATQKPYVLRKLITGLHRSGLEEPTFTPNEVLDVSFTDLFEVP